MNFDTNNSIGSGASKGTRSRAASPAVESNQPVKTTDPQTSSKPSGDQVQLSQEAQKLGQLQAKIDAAPDVNLEKVNEIRRAISEGRFQINPEKIAENLLNQESLLG